MKEIKALQALKNLHDAQNLICVAWSGGKDSSMVLELVLRSAILHPSPAPIVVIHADTGIENPEIALYVKKEIQNVREYAARHNLDVTVKIATPSLNDSWAVKIIGGRALPSFCNNNRDCSVDFKVKPQKRLRKQIFTEFSGVTPVTVIGTRYSESSSRKKKMEARQESDFETWVGKDKTAYLSPIAYWSTDDVWDYLAKQQKAGTGYSDFIEIFRIYGDATITTEVDASILSTGKKGKGCGPRFGCFLCCVTSDTSLENLIDGDPAQYGYMKGINALQKFLIATQYDFERRDWFGRTIDEKGFITIRPDVYSPNMLEELLLYCLTLDVREAEAAYHLGISKRFQIITPDILIAIDAMWSLYGRHRGFHALHCYDLVYNKNQRFDVPEVEVAKNKTVPAPRKYFVGNAWEAEREAGLAITAIHAADDSYCMGNKIISNGNQVADCETETVFSVDQEAAYLILDPDMGEFDKLIEQYNRGGYNPTCGYTYYVGLGAIQLARGKEWAADMILKRTNWKQRNGLGVGVHSSDIIEKTVPVQGVRKQLVLFPQKPVYQITESLLQAVGA